MKKVLINVIILIFVQYLFTYCTNSKKNDYAYVDGFDKIKWSASLESLKTVFNKEYSANLYSFYKIDGSDSLFYLFNFGKFKGLNVYKWKVTYYNNKLKNIDIYLENKTDLAKVYKTLFNEELKNIEKKYILEKVLEDYENNKNKTKLILNNKNKNTIISLINLNN